MTATDGLRCACRLLWAGTLLLVVGATTGAAAADKSVAIVGSGANGCASAYCFQPAMLAASPGDTVTWSNDSSTPHTVTRCTPTACDGQGPGTGADTIDSGAIDPAGNHQHTFSGTGSYFFYCSIHGYAVMHGEVDVAEATPSPTPSVMPTASPAATPAPTPAATPAPTPLPATPSPGPTPTPSATATARPASTPTPAATVLAAGLPATGDRAAAGAASGLAMVAVGLVLMTFRPRRPGAARDL